MRGLWIRLGIALTVLVVVLQQLVIPSYLEHRIANRLTDHGGSAQIDLGAVPAARLLFGDGHSIEIRADRLSVDLRAGQRDVFRRLADFDEVDVQVTSSRAGPFIVTLFRMQRVAPDRYAVAIAAEASAGDVARYAGRQLAGGFGSSLAGLAAGVLGGLSRPIPVDATMIVDVRAQPPRASNVDGSVAGLPAGPLAGIVANALLGTID
jgi:hypothetical protein